MARGRQPRKKIERQGAAEAGFVEFLQDVDPVAFVLDETGEVGKGVPGRPALLAKLQDVIYGRKIGPAYQSAEAAEDGVHRALIRVKAEFQVRARL